MVQATKAWQNVLDAMHQGDFSLEKIEPAVAEFRRAADSLASRLASPDDAVATALAANLRHQAAQMQLSLYGDGETCVWFRRSIRARSRRAARRRTTPRLGWAFRR